MVALGMPISSHLWSSQQQLSSGGRQLDSGLGLLKNRDSARKRGVVLVAGAKSKKWQWDVWERKEVTLDDSDLILLEMRRKLGESKDESLAKVVAKKLIPYATNLEVDKIVRQKGVKPFLELVKVEEEEEPKVSRGVRRNEVRLPGLRTPKSRLEVEGLQRPRRPGDPRPAAEAEYDWPDEADDVLQRFRGESVRRRPTEDMIELSPKPMGAESRTRLIYESPVASADAGIPGFRGSMAKSLIQKPPSAPKPVPELYSRPARVGDVEFLAPVNVAPRPRDLPVPSLNIRPEVRLPAPSPEAKLEEQPGQQELVVPSLSLKPEVRVPSPSLEQIPEARLPTPSPQPKQPGKQELLAPSLSLKPEVRVPSPGPEQKLEEQPGKKELVVPSLSMKPEAAPLQAPSSTPEPAREQPAMKEVVVPSLSLKPEAAPLQAPSPNQEGLREKPEKKEVMVPSLSMKPEAALQAPDSTPEPAREPAVSSARQRVPETMQKPAWSSSGDDAASSQPQEIKEVLREAPLPVLSKPRDSSQLATVADETKNVRVESTLPVLSTPPAKEFHLGEEEVNLSNFEAMNQGVPEEAKVKQHQEQTVPVLNKPPAKLEIEATGSAEETFQAVTKELPVPALAPPPSGAMPVEADKETSDEHESSKHQAPAPQEEIDRDWALAEAALESKAIQEVVFIGSNAGGMIARLGCLNGFLPGRDLLEARGLKTFRSWARERGYDVNHTSVWDSSEGVDSTFSASKVSSQGLDKDAESNSLHPACEVDVNKLYRDYRVSLLSSLVGERASVTVTLVDRTMKKLVFSEKKAVLLNPDVAQKRSEFMAKLKVGDVLKGRVKNISLFGVFVELLEDVTGLIHFSELSWTPVSDPAELVTVGEELEVMVLKLDRDRQRINLSLKRMTDDPLLESLESMLAREAPQSESKPAPVVPEFDELLRKLEARDEIQSAVKGRCVDGAAFVPSFQVYLSSTLPEGYKLLARFENHVQEVLLVTSISRDALIDIIRESTSTQVVEEQEQV